ncbi:hypothetical protein Tco_0223216 [Tanacetum coccineum]
MPQTDFIDISSNESTPIQNYPTNTSQPLNSINTTFNLTNATIDTTLALTIPPPTSIQTIPTQEPMISSLAPRALTFSTPPSSPVEPHPYLTSLNDLLPRSSNPLSALPPFTTTLSQIPSPHYFTTTSTTTMPPFRSSLTPSSTLVPLDQSLWIEGPPIPPLQEHTYPHCQRTETIVNNLQNEIGFMLNHILERLNHLSNQQP